MIKSVADEMFFASDGDEVGFMKCFSLLKSQNIRDLGKENIFVKSIIKFYAKKPQPLPKNKNCG